MKNFSLLNRYAIFGLLLVTASVGAQQSTASLNATDKMFIENATQGGMAEVKLGQLAGEKGKAESVKSFGEKMVKDHSEANEKLAGIVKGLNANTPMDVSAKQKATYTKLSSLSGAAFDKAFSKVMIQDHKSTIALFQKEVKMGSNAELKTFANDTLPTIKMHLSMTKDLPK